MITTRIFFVTPADQLPGDRVVTEPSIIRYIRAWFLLAEQVIEFADECARGGPTAERTVLIARQVAARDSYEPALNPDPELVEGVLRSIAGAAVVDDQIIGMS